MRLPSRNLGDERAQAIRVALAAMQVDRRRAAVLVPEPAESLEQEVDRRAVREAAVQDRDPRLLLAMCHRRGGRGEQPGHERAPPHRVTFWREPGWISAAGRKL